MTKSTDEKIWELIVRRADRVDAVWWYTKARAVGVAVDHSESTPCFTWDSVAGHPGAFRSIGVAVFIKSTRRWKVEAFSDCIAAELSTLIAAGVSLADGSWPGPGLRAREWNHREWPNHGGAVAFAYVAYKLDVDDLLAGSGVAVEVPDAVPEVLSRAIGQ